MWRLSISDDGVGKIQMDDFRESFISDLSFWSKSDYERHWSRAAKALDKGSPVVFITSITDPTSSNIFRSWACYPAEGELIFQEHILFLEELERPFNLEEPHNNTPPTSPSQKMVERYPSGELGLKYNNSLLADNSLTASRPKIAAKLNVLNERIEMIDKESALVNLCKVYPGFRDKYAEGFSKFFTENGEILWLSSISIPLTDLVCINLKNNNFDHIDSLFDEIENLISNGTQEVREIVCTGFLEGMQNQLVIEGRYWSPLLGVAATEFCKSMDAFYGTKTQGLKCYS